MERAELKVIYKEDWVEALRSGKYAQVRDGYCGDRDNEFCATGVLMHISGITPLEMKVLPLNSILTFLITQMGGTIDFGKQIIKFNDFAKMNFDQIADIIESTPLKSRPAPNDNPARIVEEEMVLV